MGRNDPVGHRYPMSRGDPMGLDDPRPPRSLADPHFAVACVGSHEHASPRANGACARSPTHDYSPGEANPRERATRTCSRPKRITTTAWAWREPRRLWQRPPLDRPCARPVGIRPRRKQSNQGEKRTAARCVPRRRGTAWTTGAHADVRPPGMDVLRSPGLEGGNNRDGEADVGMRH